MREAEALNSHKDFTALLSSLCCSNFLCNDRGGKEGQNLLPFSELDFVCVEKRIEEAVNEILLPAQHPRAQSGVFHRKCSRVILIKRCLSENCLLHRGPLGLDHPL